MGDGLGRTSWWIELPNWPVFNIADSAIVCSGIFMTWLAMRNIQPIRHDENNNVHNEDKK